MRGVRERSRVAPARTQVALVGPLNAALATCLPTTVPAALERWNPTAEQLQERRAMTGSAPQPDRTCLRRHDRHGLPDPATADDAGSVPRPGLPRNESTCPTGAFSPNCSWRSTKTATSGSERRIPAAGFPPRSGCRISTTAPTRTNRAISADHRTRQPTTTCASAHRLTHTSPMTNNVRAKRAPRADARQVRRPEEPTSTALLLLSVPSVQ